MAKKNFFRFNTNTLEQHKRKEAEKARRAKQRKIDNYKKFLREIPAVIAGDLPANNTKRKRVYGAFWSSVILTLFTEIYEGYIAKSAGQADNTGSTWPGLSRPYKAYGRNRRGHLSQNQRRKLKADTRGLLTPAQNTRWRQIFFNVYNKRTKKGKETDPQVMREAKEVAAKVAWSKVKEMGGETLIEALGDADMPIMKDTGTLLRSFKPGRINNTRTGRQAYVKGDRNQVVDFVRDGVKIGTKVPYAKMAEGKGKSRRPLWPKNMKVWYDKAISAGRDALAEELKSIGI